MVAYCGLICTDCPAHIATQANDDKQRQAVAEGWTKRYKHDFKVADINCDGCVSTGRHVGQCSICEVRLCGIDRGFVNCAYCPEYSCAKLDKYFKMAPIMKNNLEKIRRKLK